jgi:hypothetical protein
MPDWCSWTETYRPKQAAPAKKAPWDVAIKEIVVTKAGDIRRDLEAWDNGSARDLWIVKGVELFAYPESPTIVVRNAATDEDARTFQSPDFGGLPALSLQNYVDVATYRGVQCYHFLIKRTKPEGDATAYTAAERAETRNREAWIDVKSKLPVALDDGESIRLYTFSPDRPAPLALPDKFAAELQHYVEVVREMSRNSAIR